MEVVKYDLSTVFYNHQTGTLGIKEGNEMAKMLKSQFVSREINKNSGYSPYKGRIVSSMARYL